MNEQLREEIRQVVQACPFGPLTELLNRCYVALGERPAHDVARQDISNRSKRLDEIRAEAERFFEWPGDDRSTVTLTSCILFADHIAAPSAPVVMPDRRAQALAGVSLFDLGHAKGWNACLDEFARLNGGKP